MSVRRNTAYNLSAAVIPLAVTLVTLPAYLRVLGEERYGVLVILWTLLGYFGLFDMGLGRAITNRIAAFKERTAFEREEVFWTTFVVSLVTGCMGALILWLVAKGLFHSHFAVSGKLTTEVFASIPWLVLAFPLLLSYSVVSGALMGREEFLAQNLVELLAGISIQVVPLVTAYILGPELPGLVIGVVVIRLLSTLAMLGCCINCLPLGLKPRFNRVHLRPLLGFGGWVTITGLVGPLLTSLDRLIIGVVGGASSVAQYAIPYSLVTRMAIIPTSLANALFPRFSSVKDTEGQTLFDTALASLVTIITPVAVAVVLLIEPFLVLWVGKDLAARSAPVGEVLAVGLWANSLARLPYSIIQARGRPDVIAKFHLAEVVPYLIVMWFALNWFGVLGAAVAWTLRVWADAALLFSAARAVKAKKLVPPALVLFIAAAVTLVSSGTDWRALTTRSAVLCIATAWAFHNSPIALRSLLKDSATSFRGRWVNKDL